MRRTLGDCLKLLDEPSKAYFSTPRDIFCTIECHSNSNFDLDVALTFPARRPVAQNNRTSPNDAAETSSPYLEAHKSCVALFVVRRSSPQPKSARKSKNCHPETRRDCDLRSIPNKIPVAFVAVDSERQTYCVLKYL